MHLFAPEVGLMGTSGIVGPCVLQAAGAGYSFKVLKSDRVSVAFFGDGVIGNGAFHEALNMASIWNLPVLFVCENNGYATEVPFTYAAKVPEVGPRGRVYGITGLTVDGNDALAVCEAAGEAVARARTGGGPTLLECRTYRLRAHAEGMRDGGYRTQAEVDEWKARDAIAALRRRLVADFGATDEELDRADAEVKAAIDAAFEFAKASPWPEPDSGARHVYAGE
jgi:TPP-dependent pyruvate/acetoin dehydrogenase alpha subunit